MRSRIILFVLAAIILYPAASALAKSADTEALQVGDKAPSFTLPDQDGKNVTLNDFQGKKAIVLYFYPQDDKLVCKKQACLFRDSYKQFVEIGAEVAKPL